MTLISDAVALKGQKEESKHDLEQPVRKYNLAAYITDCCKARDSFCLDQQ
jgi:hypothetical protein